MNPAINASKLSLKLKRIGAAQAEKATRLKPAPVAMPTEDDGLFVPDSELRHMPLTTELIDNVLWAMGDEWPGFMRPSMIGGCKRASYFHLTRVHQKPQKHDPKMQRVLATGTVYHGILQEYLGKSLDIYFAPESPVWHQELAIRGSCDGVCITRDLKFKWCIEIKTSGKATFEKLTKPDPKHVWQAHTYAGLHYQGWEGMKWIDIIYICKDNQQWKPFRVPYSEETFQEIVQWTTNIRKFAERGVAPAFNEHECDVNFCTFVDHCFKLRDEEKKAANFKKLASAPLPNSLVRKLNARLVK